MDFSKFCLFRQTFNGLLSDIYHTIGPINNIYKLCEKRFCLLFTRDIVQSIFLFCVMSRRLVTGSFMFDFSRLSLKQLSFVLEGPRTRLLNQFAFLEFKSIIVLPCSGT